MTEINDLCNGDANSAAAEEESWEKEKTSKEFRIENKDLYRSIGSGRVPLPDLIQ